METFYRSIPEFIVKTDDITKLSNRACDNLKLGDEVILLDGDDQVKYNITSKSADGMKLASITGEAVVEVIYSKEGNDWSYVEIKTTELGGAGTSLKTGNYILNEDGSKLVYIGDDEPEDYTGIGYYFGDDGLTINRYINGSTTFGTYISPYAIDISVDEKSASMTENGVNKLNFAEITHSFNELDPTLKQIVETAISTALAQPCTQEQWNTIKALLDKSLYLNYLGISLIKALTDGISDYTFGIISNSTGQTIELSYDNINSQLEVRYYEI